MIVDVIVRDLVEGRLFLVITKTNYLMLFFFCKRCFKDFSFTLILYRKDLLILFCVTQKNSFVAQTLLSLVLQKMFFVK